MHRFPVDSIFPRDDTIIPYHCFSKTKKWGNVGWYKFLAKKCWTPFSWFAHYVATALTHTLTKTLALTLTVTLTYTQT